MKNTKHNKLKAKGNNLENIIFDETTLVQINQYKTWRKKTDMLIKKPDVSGLVTTTVHNAKIAEVENKISHLIVW